MLICLAKFLRAAESGTSECRGKAVARVRELDKNQKDLKGVKWRRQSSGTYILIVESKASLRRLSEAKPSVHFSAHRPNVKHTKENLLNVKKQLFVNRMRLCRLIIHV